MLNCNTIGHDWQIELMDKQVLIPDRYHCTKCKGSIWVKTTDVQRWDIEKEDISDREKSLKLFMFDKKVKLLGNPLLSRWTKAEKKKEEKVCFTVKNSYEG